MLEFDKIEIQRFDKKINATKNGGGVFLVSIVNDNEHLIKRASSHENVKRASSHENAIALKIENKKVNNWG